MIIITADDYGKNVHATDSILACFRNERITSASAMVFMEDSERAAMLALQTDLEIGLHLNFTMQLTADRLSPNIREHHNRVVSYLTKNKVAQIIYNPFLARSFNFLFLSQHEEFLRLYGRQPDFYNGHHHMHLCANMLLQNLIPRGARTRRTFTFNRGEKNVFNRLYRCLLDSIVTDKYISTDSFYSILPVHNYKRLQDIVNQATRDNVEIEVHPENSEEMEFLLSDKYQQLLKICPKRSFQQISYNN